MTRVFLADARSEERSALRLLLQDLKMEVVGEAADWPATLAQVPLSSTDMLLVDWDLLHSAPAEALGELRKICPAALVIVLISHLDTRLLAVLTIGSELIISRRKIGERVAECRRNADPPAFL